MRKENKVMSGVYPQWYTAKHIVLPYILKYTNRHDGMAPTLREIGDNFGRTREWARLMVVILAKMKLVKFERMKNRSVILLNK